MWIGCRNRKGKKECRIGFSAFLCIFYLRTFYVNIRIDRIRCSDPVGGGSRSISYLLFLFTEKVCFTFFICRRDMLAGNAGCIPEYFNEKPYNAGIYSAHCNGAVPGGYLECIGKREAQNNYDGSQSACCGNSDIFCREFYICLSGYRGNAEINQINHAKMLEAKKNYQVNGEKTERIELYKLKDDRFANIMPYQPSHEGIEYWMKSYYELPMDVPIFWQRAGEKRVIEILEGEWYDDGLMGKSMKLRFDSNFENIITLRVNNTKQIEGQCITCTMGDFEAVYHVSVEGANEFYLTVPAGENEIDLTAAETVILQEDGREVSVALEVVY